MPQRIWIFSQPSTDAHMYSMLSVLLEASCVIASICMNMHERLDRNVPSGSSVERDINVLGDE